jgi:hypothetical protein
LTQTTGFVLEGHIYLVRWGRNSGLICGKSQTLKWQYCVLQSFILSLIHDLHFVVTCMFSLVKVSLLWSSNEMARAIVLTSCEKTVKLVFNQIIKVCWWWSSHQKIRKIPHPHKNWSDTGKGQSIEYQKTCNN